MSNLYEVSDVCLRYPRVSGAIRSLLSGRQAPARKALDDISFTVKKGEGLALIGLNGSGKSTLLRVLAGIYEPETGSVEINGKVAALFNLGIGMRVDMSGRANIMMMGRIAGFTKAEMHALLPSIIEFSELGHVIDDPMITYSQGMAMRLSFATATSLNAEILLLDEWIGAGDRVFRLKAERRLDEMVRKAHGFVLASHNTAIVKRYCKTAIWLHEGRCKQIGEVDEIIAAFDAFTNDKS